MTATASAAAIAVSTTRATIDRSRSIEGARRRHPGHDPAAGGAVDALRDQHRRGRWERTRDAARAAIAAGAIVASSSACGAPDGLARQPPRVSQSAQTTPAGSVTKSRAAGSGVQATAPRKIRASLATTMARPPRTGVP